MCKPATCSKCSKTTWTGCGQHVDQVMSQVPAGKQCRCANPAPSSGGGWLSRLFGR